MVLYTDKKSLYYAFMGINFTAEKRLRIELFPLRKSYELHEIPEVGWSPSSQSPADALTKRNPRKDLDVLISKERYDWKQSHVSSVQMLN